MVWVGALFTGRSTREYAGSSLTPYIGFSNQEADLPWDILTRGNLEKCAGDRGTAGRRQVFRIDSGVSVFSGPRERK